MNAETTRPTKRWIVTYRADECSAPMTCSYFAWDREHAIEKFLADELWSESDIVSVDRPRLHNGNVDTSRDRQPEPST